MAEIAAEASGRRLPVVLLTPYFRDAELRRVLPLFRAIPEGAGFEVALNDWGALQAVRGLFPRMNLSLGRLLSGQKRCPRIGVSPRLTEEGRAWHGEGLFSSARAREQLASVYGIARYHVDDLPWGADSVPAGTSGPSLFVHSPWAVVTVSDACPWIGGVSSATVASCPRPCRGGMVALREPSMGAEMVLRGKARFVDVRELPKSPPGGTPGCGKIFYGEPP
jgi:hypothetical protein